MSRSIRKALHSLAVLALITSVSCSRGPLESTDHKYVSAPQVVLRDKVATIFNKVGTATNGERLEIFETQRRFARVRTPRGEEGWVELRHLVDADVFETFQKIAADNKDTAVQGHGVARVDLNMHLTPARDGAKLYQLKEGEKVEILKRATAERLSAQQIQARQRVEARQATFLRQLEEAKLRAKRQQERNKKKNKMKPLAIALSRTTPVPPADWDQKTVVNQPTTTPDGKPIQKVYDDWWLVRNNAGQVGWVLARMVDLEVPLEVAQYAEGQRIMGAYVLNKVRDGDKEVPQYLMLLNEPKDGSAFDFNQLRVFTWNVKRHRYETAYRERNFIGYFPTKTAMEDFGRDGGVLPVFTVRKQNEDGTVTERKYRLMGPIVKQVYAPGEEPKKAAAAEVRPAVTRPGRKKGR